ncbi:MAG: hypothetical protein J5I90_15745 [Caldilineales bacterium]|nr:hypothetical protein [Caldilineales bacterium]
MKSNRQLIPTLVIALAALLLGSLLPLSNVFGQGGQPPAAQDAASPDAVDAAVGTAFTYQGNLRKSDQPVNVNCSFQFSLWDALTGGAQKGTTQIVNNTQVRAGTFSVQLDFGNQFTGDARWLQTAVQCAGDGGYVTLSPRQSLNAVPYAVGLRPGAVMQSAAPGDAFFVEKTAANSNAIHGKGTATGSIGVWGEGVNNTGVYGLSQGGKGVWGKSTSESGVYGVSESWAGVWGESTGASGVVGVSAGQFNGGVYGVNTGKGYGVYGKAPNSAGVFGESTDWIGVYGKSTNHTGVVGESDSNDGVRGTTTAPYHIGVKGVANRSGSVGVWGESSANIGVYGQSDAPLTGAALWGKNTAGGIALKAEGNAVQSQDKAGLPKAMLYINAAGQIVRCYNGVTGSSSVPCGFTSAKDTAGGYGSFQVDFGFLVTSRFASITQVQSYGSDIWQHWAYIKRLSGTTALVESSYEENRAVTGCGTNPFCEAGPADFILYLY